MTGNSSVLINSLDYYTDHPPKRRANGHRRHEDPSRHLAAVRDHDQPQAQDGRDEERVDHRPLGRGLAEMVVVARAIAFAEEDGHALGHVDAHEMVEPADHGGDRRKRDRLGDGVVLEVALTECSDLEVELDHEGTVETLCVRAR